MKKLLREPLVHFLLAGALLFVLYGSGGGGGEGDDARIVVGPEQIERLRPVVAKLADDFEAVLLRTQAIFDEAARRVGPTHWIWDGVHPLPQGHELIARSWIEAVAKAWA